MRKLSVVLVLVIFAVFCGCAVKIEPANPEAFGTKWELLGVGAKKIQHFFAPESITQHDSIIKYKARFVNTLGYEAIGWVELDCARNKVRVFNGVRYDKYHRYVGTLLDNPWQDVRRSSIFKQTKQRLCK